MGCEASTRTARGTARKLFPSRSRDDRRRWRLRPNSCDVRLKQPFRVAIGPPYVICRRKRDGGESAVWDDLDENDGLLGWGGNDEFDRLLAGSAAGYGAVSQQPARQRGMSYPKARRKSAAQIEAEDPTVIPCSQGFFSRMFGGKVLRYKPSAADLQEHPGARRKGRDLTEGEALLEESEDGRGRQKRHMRNRSLTASSGNTTDSFSSRGDIFPSDEEDAIPLDDEFAMVLERRNTNPVIETESSSNRTGSDKRAKRPSVGSRNSTRRTMSSRSIRSSLGKKSRSRAESNAQTPIEEHTPDMVEEPAEVVGPPSLTELKHEEQRIAEEEEAEVQRWRSKAQRLAADRGLPGDSRQDNELPSKEATPEPASPQIKAAELIPAIQHNGMDVEAGEGPPASVNVAADGNRTEEGAD